MGECMAEDESVFQVNQLLRQGKKSLAHDLIELLHKNMLIGHK